MTEKTEEQLNAEEVATFIDPTKVSPGAEEEKPPVEEQKAEEVVKETPAEEEPEADPEPEAEESKDKKSANRFTKQTRELRETQRQLKALEEKFAALAAEKPALTPEKQDDKKGAVEAPNPENYRYGELDPQFVRDTAAFEAKTAVERALAAQRAEMQTQQQDAARQAEVVKLQQKATEVEALGASKFEDFVEVVTRGAENGDYPLTQEMFELAVETEAAPEILYYLAKNPEEAEQVSEMTPRQQALWFGRLEVKLTARQPRKATLAPVPISSARGSGSAVTTPAATTDFAAFERAAMAKG